MESPPWKTKQLRKLGEYIRDGVEVPPGLPAYDDVMLFYSDVAAEAQETIQGIDWSDLLGTRPFEVTSRPKTIDTLRQKLNRDHSTPLPSIQDIAGVRFEAEMSLDEQDAVANAIAGVFGQELSDCVRDLRLTPRSGYRAVHLWLRLPVRVEVQIRTHLQSSWANMYESLADVVGRGIRYGELPATSSAAGLVKKLQALSIENISTLEASRNKILSLEHASNRAWDAVRRLPAGTREQIEMREDATELQESVESLRVTVADSEKTVRTTMDSMKEAFDRIRTKGR